MAPLTEAEGNVVGEFKRRTEVRKSRDGLAEFPAVFVRRRAWVATVSGVLCPVLRPPAFGGLQEHTTVVAVVPSLIPTSVLFLLLLLLLLLLFLTCCLFCFCF